MTDGRGNSVNHAWTDPIVARLRELHAQGLSCSRAAKALNTEFKTAFSRSAIIGKLNRLGLSWRGASAPAPQQFNQFKTAKIAKAREIVQVLADAKCSPVSAGGIKAVEHLLFATEYKGRVEAGDITSAVLGLGLDADKEAAVLAVAHNIPQWKALAAVLFRRASRGRRRAA